MRELLFNHSYAGPFVRPDEIELLAPAVALAHRQLHEGTGAGSSFLGWLDLPAKFDRGGTRPHKEAAQRIQDRPGPDRDRHRRVLSGSPGRDLRVIPLLLQPAEERGPPVAPDFLCGAEHQREVPAGSAGAGGRPDISVNVISKSGTTTEPAIAFRLFRELLEKKYGAEGARERIYVPPKPPKVPCGAWRKRKVTPAL